MNEKIEALQIAAHQAAKAGDYDQAVTLLHSLQTNHQVNNWNVVFYSTFYQYVRPNQSHLSLSHVTEINKAVVDAFALVLSQDVDILETLVCFQDVYDQIWNLCSELLLHSHKEYIGLVKGKSITEAFHQSQTKEYLHNLRLILSLSDHFINALGNLSQYTTVNLDLIWDFFQCNDGIYAFLLAYEPSPDLEKKREENVKIILLKRPDYTPEKIPSPALPSELRQNSTTTPPKKKGFLARLFQ